MQTVLRTILAVIAAMALTIVLLIAVEFLSSIVHPFPPNFDGNIPAHVRRYPAWVLAVVVVLWDVTAAVATWVATRLGNRIAGSLVALLLFWALVFNLSMLPYPMWFKVAMIMALPMSCAFGIVFGRNRRATALDAGNERRAT